jgi:hypothetical protein
MSDRLPQKMLESKRDDKYTYSYTSLVALEQAALNFNRAPSRTDPSC